MTDDCILYPGGAGGSLIRVGFVRRVYNVECIVKSVQCRVYSVESVQCNPLSVKSEDIHDQCYPD